MPIGSFTSSLSLALLVLVLLGGCRTQKELPSADVELKKKSPAFLKKKVDSKVADFQWFYGKAKMDYEDNKDSQKFTANIRMLKDSIVWVSVTAIMGYEAARAYATPDTLYLMDKMDKIYYKRHGSFVDKYLPLSFDIKLLQNIFTGNTSWMLDGKLKSSTEQGFYKLESKMGRWEAAWWITPDDFTVYAFSLDDTEAQSNVLMQFWDYEEENGRWFSKERKITFTGGKNEQAVTEINFNRLRWDEPQEFPFHVPDKYKRDF